MTKSRSNFKLGLVWFIVGSSLAACSSIKPKALDPHANVGQKIAALDREVKQDEVSHAALLAPDDLKRADARVQDARRALFAAERRDRLLRKTGLAEAHVEHVRRLVAERQPLMADVLQGREAAIDAGALKFATTRERFQKLDELFRERVPKTESRRQTLMRGYRDVEVTAVRERVLRTAHEQMGEARRLDARRAAPKALRAAERAMTVAEVAIARDPRRPEAFQHHVAVAERLSRALVGIAAQARVVSARSDEDVARELLLQKQRLGQLRSELAGVELNSSVRERQLRAVTAENQLNAALEQARRSIGEDTANVYRAGDRLLIRLKNDPTSAATLNKVKGVIRTMNARDVLVQGGTARRAAAVSDALNEVAPVGRLVGPETARVEVLMTPRLKTR